MVLCSNKTVITNPMDSVQQNSWEGVLVIWKPYFIGVCEISEPYVIMHYKVSTTSLNRAYQMRTREQPVVEYVLQQKSQHC